MPNRYSRGVLYKKIVKSDTKQPFFPYSLAKLIFMDNGETVENTVTKLSLLTDELKNAKTYLIYESDEEYNTAYNAGEIPDDTLCIVSE